MNYIFPPIELLDDIKTQGAFDNQEYVDSLKEELISTMDSYKIEGQLMSVEITPFSVVFEVMPAYGVSVKVFKNHRAEFELRLGNPVEILENEKGKNSVRIAVKSLKRPIIGFRTLLETPEYLNMISPLTVVIGYDILGGPLYYNIEEAPHMLIAGTTGSGKSVFLDNIILSLLYKASPNDVRIIMVDPKIVDMNYYKDIPHLLGPVMNDMNKAYDMLLWLEDEMSRRYEVFSKFGVRDINGYNQKNPNNKIPKIVFIIDEYMELMLEAPKEMELIINRLSSMARAVGIHLIITTQRPSSDVITNSIKANIPCRASLTVVDWRESRLILDRTGAQRLLGNGDMMFSTSGDGEPIHIQAAMVTDREIKRVVKYVVDNNQWE